MNTTPEEFDLHFDSEDFEEVEESSIEDLQRIISYNVANTIEVLKMKIDNEEIDLQPEFQRDFVWDINRASLFIDSLILGLPIPSIFLGKRSEDDSYMVIDGQQRLKSVFFYLTGNFTVNGQQTIFSLRNLSDRDWNGRTYAELDERIKRKIRNAVINTTIIEDIDSQPKVVHDLFHRLNTGGMPLTDQEIRNCVYGGVFNRLLINLNTNREWRLLIGIPNPDKRLRDVELILRFYALLFWSTDYRPSMKIFLSNFQDHHKNDSEFVSTNERLFVETLFVIHANIGDNAFRTTRSVNKSMTDAIMVSIAQIIQAGTPLENVRENYNRLIHDDLFIRYTQSGTTTPTNVRGRIDIARNYFLGLR